ncbi:hypothetical protein [Neopusillimonas maritima]|jgi:hypothetical protein|uniref:GIY-YIG domain-containing protein n=1 Tax=Neopusillimonas maritima TaxID=2026239 RepID=A0ABX9MWA8_9BURK|nr:hypothetical protein [Neopusillimonas maritima]RII83203.1 hypothetical protein CJO09_06235 [Neopusillimonas maritima]|tara:strand:+ start:443 stop:949 length:507 start_codon:yes stop_codon:yes gene_type:complete
MTLDDPSDFHLSLSGGAYRLLRDSLVTKFATPLSTRGIAKLYTVSDGDLLLYVGISQQPMSSRLNYGFRADGKSGYYGYKWKAHEGTLRLSVWTAQSNGEYVPLRELESIEAEVAFLCRQDSGQWPAFQHEIHFYPSSPWHREAAARIYSHALRGNTASCQHLDNHAA